MDETTTQDDATTFDDNASSRQLPDPLIDALEAAERADLAPDENPVDTQLVRSPLIRWGTLCRDTTPH